MFQTEFLGFVAGTLTTLAFVPQVLKTYRTKSARDVSMAMFVIFTCGVFMWLTFGFVQGIMSVFITNLIVFFLSLLQIILKIKYDKIENQQKQKTQA
ncbi:MAG: SemiSWEET transporter [Elusimicrobia bacterium]|nr:SemiSWEET transporter [Elusimicrobiota bacterium]